MPPSLRRAGLLIAVVAVVVAGVMVHTADPARAAEPHPSPFVGAAEAAGLACESTAVDWSCLEPQTDSGDRTFFALVTEAHGSFSATVSRSWPEPRPAEPDVLALMEEFIELALDDDADAISWLRDAHDARRETASLERGPWRLDWYAEWGTPQDGVWPSLQLILSHNPTGEAPGSPVPLPAAPPELDECTLLTEQEVESVTGMGAQAGVTKELVIANAVGCGWGTAPYEVQLYYSVAPSGRAVDGLGAGDPVDGVGDGARWLWCEPEPGVSRCYSTNSLVVAFRTIYVTILFAPGDAAAGYESTRLQATHRTWAIVLAELILPRIERAFESVAQPSPSPFAVPTDAAASGEPGSTATPDPSPASTPIPSATPAAAAGNGTATGDGHPRSSTFAGSIPAPSAVSTNPAVLLQSALLAALLVFLMPFPSQLFNSTLENHEDEVRRWLRLDRLGAAARGLGSFWASWPGVALFTGLAAVLYGFLDPAFGLDLRSVGTFLGMLLGIVLVTIAFAVPTVLAHRRLGDRPRPAVVPISLLIGIVCVLISRITNFQPGYLYGLLIGLAFARELSSAEEGRTTATGAALMLGLAFVAWLVLGALPEGAGFGLVVARTMLAALMVAGLEGVVFGLLPMRFLPGEALYSWNRLLWGGLLLAGAFAFFHILINPASGYLSDTSRTPLLTVIGLLLGFSLVSVAFWAWFRFREEPGPAPRQRPEGAP